MKRNILIALTTAILVSISTASALPAISPEVKPKAEAAFAKLQKTMSKDSEAVQLTKLKARLNSLIGNVPMYKPLDPYREGVKTLILAEIERLNAKTVSKYQGCDTPDIAIGRQVWSACNVGSSKSGTGSRNFGDYFVYGNNATIQKLDWKSYQNGWKSKWNEKDRGPCAIGYHVPTADEWKELFGYEGCSLSASKTGKKNASCVGTITERLSLPGAGYHYEKNGFRKTSFSGNQGNYWSSTSKVKNNAFTLGFELDSKDPRYGQASLGTDTKISARSVRCVKD